MRSAPGRDWRGRTRRRGLCGRHRDLDARERGFTVAPDESPPSPNVAVSSPPSPDAVIVTTWPARAPAGVADS